MFVSLTSPEVLEAESVAGAEPPAKPEGLEEVPKEPTAKIDVDHIDVFSVEDIFDLGNGEPLFANFQFEDWSMLSLRFELHLLSHAFRKDANDADRVLVPLDHLPFYYNRYFKKALSTKTYGADTVEEVARLVRDTLLVTKNPISKLRVLESQLPEELECLNIFVMLTEEHRRERQRRIDLGDDAARLKFLTPGASSVLPPGSLSSGSASPGSTPIRGHCVRCREPCADPWATTATELWDARSTSQPSRPRADAALAALVRLHRQCDDPWVPVYANFLFVEIRQHGEDFQPRGPGEPHCARSDPAGTRCARPKEPSLCYSCGSNEHLARDCSQSICHFCGRSGHLARQCHFGQTLDLGDQFILCSERCAARRFLMPMHHARSVREDLTDASEIRLTFCGGDPKIPWDQQVDVDRGDTVVVTGGLVRGLRPDERSVAARLRDALEAKGDSGGSRRELGLRKDCLTGDTCVLLLLDPEGQDFQDVALALKRREPSVKQVLVLLGDDKGLAPEELNEVEGMISEVEELRLVVQTEREELQRLFFAHRFAVEASLQRLADAELGEIVSADQELTLATVPEPRDFGSMISSPTLQPYVLETSDPTPENPFKDIKEVHDSKTPKTRVSTTSANSGHSVVSAHSVQSAAMFTFEVEEERRETSQPDSNADTVNERGQSFKKVTNNAVDIFLQEPQAQGWERWKKCLKASIDYVAAVLVLLNSIVLMMELEFKGNAIGAKMGLSTGPSLDEIQPVFQGLDRFFVFIFLAELLIRIAVEQRDFIKEWTNYLDAALVILGLVDFGFSLQVSDGDVVPKDIVLLRLMRALKSLRAIRMMRSFRLFRGLRLLVKACQCFLPSLCWAMVLLGVFMTMGALIMGNLLQSFLTDETASFEDREWIWMRYGTAYRATGTWITFTATKDYVCWQLAYQCPSCDGES
eukprot:s667_g5.t1